MPTDPKPPPNWFVPALWASLLATGSLLAVMMSASTA